jgi:hypothetical protein
MTLDTHLGVGKMDELIIFVARTVRVGNDWENTFAGFLGFVAAAIAWFITIKYRENKRDKGEEPNGSGFGMFFLLWMGIGIVFGIILQAFK